jgi:hypothetical protein
MRLPHSRYRKHKYEVYMDVASVFSKRNTKLFSSWANCTYVDVRRVLCVKKTCDIEWDQIPPKGVLNCASRNLTGPRVLLEVKVKFSLCLINYLSTTPWRFMGKWKYNSNVVASAQDGGEWSASRPWRFTHGDGVRSSHLIGGWAGLRTFLESLEKRKSLSPVQFLSRISNILLLYRVSYPGSFLLEFRRSKLLGPSDFAQKCQQC